MQCSYIIVQQAQGMSTVRLKSLQQLLERSTRPNHMRRYVCDVLNLIWRNNVQMWFILAKIQTWIGFVVSNLIYFCLIKCLAENAYDKSEVDLIKMCSICFLVNHDGFWVVFLLVYSTIWIQIILNYDVKMLCSGVYVTFFLHDLVICYGICLMILYYVNWTTLWLGHEQLWGN